MRPEVREARKRFESAKRNGKLRQRDHCSRCGETDRLSLHHVVSLEQGGDPVEQSNLDTLCYYCHREWHVFWENLRPDYRAFKAATPFRP